MKSIELFAALGAMACVVMIYAWLFYCVYIMYRILHHVDAIVDPIGHEITQHWGDMLVFRIHRLIIYGGSAAWPWFNRRTFPSYDFRKLPRPLRIRLALQFYGMVTPLFLLAAGYSAMKLVGI
ncbi:MAG: hypothetical protein WED00_13700 [Aquisalimonadaceae bacterium]